MRPHGLQISKPNFSHFQDGRHDDQVDSVSQALGHKSRSLWTDASLEGYGNFSERARAGCNLWAARRPSMVTKVRRARAQDMVRSARPRLIAEAI